MKKTSVTWKILDFVASESVARERIMRDPDWTAELVRDVHGARGVGCFHAPQPFFISQIFRPYVVHASRLFEKSCTLEVLLFLSPAVNVF